MSHPNPMVIAIEGLDRLGKSTLIDGILNATGNYMVHHFQKPKKLKYYDDKYDGYVIRGGPYVEPDMRSRFCYQVDSFNNSMALAKAASDSGRDYNTSTFPLYMFLLYDRWHLGEAVYAPMYREYDGDYVFELEKANKLGEAENLRLILLTEDFEVSRHFVDDGESFDPTKREAEQKLFIEAFNKSIIQDKRIINVTDPYTGNFRSADAILLEALA